VVSLLQSVLASPGSWGIFIQSTGSEKQPSRAAWREGGIRHLCSQSPWGWRLCRSQDQNTERRLKRARTLFSLLLDTMTDFVFVGSDITVQCSAKFRIEESAPFQLTIWKLHWFGHASLEGQLNSLHLPLWKWSALNWVWTWSIFIFKNCTCR